MTRPDLRKLLQSAEGPGFPTRGGGKRYYVPNTKGLDVFRVSPGDPKLDPGNVHSGPHCYVSRVGTCFPLKGNTAPWPAPALNDEQFFDHVMLETLEDAVGIWEPTAMAAATFAEQSSDDHKQRARTVVRRVLERRWAQLFEKDLRTSTGLHWSPVPNERLVTSLATWTDDGLWDPERIGDAPVRFYILGSDIGDRQFHDELRRRGLYS